MKDCTTIDHPFCLYDAENNTNMESFGGNGVLVCSIDNLPTELPREATEFFGSLLMPHIDDMVCFENFLIQKNQSTRQYKILTS